MVKIRFIAATNIANEAIRYRARDPGHTRAVRFLNDDSASPVAHFAHKRIIQGPGEVKDIFKEPSVLIQGVGIRAAHLIGVEVVDHDRSGLNE